MRRQAQDKRRHGDAEVALKIASIEKFMASWDKENRAAKMETSKADSQVATKEFATLREHLNQEVEARMASDDDCQEISPFVRFERMKQRRELDQAKMDSENGGPSAKNACKKDSTGGSHTSSTATCNHVE